jgi:hypothetical protein
VRRQRRFGNEVEAASIRATQVKGLIDSIDRFVQLLNYDIETEEQRTRCSDCRDPDYSVLARSLTARRDNLATTTAALQERLARGLTPDELHSSIANVLGDVDGAMAREALDLAAEIVRERTRCGGDDGLGFLQRVSNIEQPTGTTLCSKCLKGYPPG